jgi:hypothetical protein
MHLLSATKDIELCHLICTMAAMAKDYLTVQAWSVSAVRAFSSRTDLVTADRCSLGEKVIEKTQFLKFISSAEPVSYFET